MFLCVNGSLIMETDINAMLHILLLILWYRSRPTAILCLTVELVAILCSNMSDGEFVGQGNVTGVRSSPLRIEQLT